MPFISARSWCDRLFSCTCPWKVKVPLCSVAEISACIHYLAAPFPLDSVLIGPFLLRVASLSPHEAKSFPGPHSRSCRIVVGYHSHYSLEFQPARLPHHIGDPRFSRLYPVPLTSLFWPSFLAVNRRLPTVISIKISFRISVSRLNLKSIARGKSKVMISNPAKRIEGQPRTRKSWSAGATIWRSQLGVISKLIQYSTYTMINLCRV